jgi:hypothetical protein
MEGVASYADHTHMMDRATDAPRVMAPFSLEQELAKNDKLQQSSRRSYLAENQQSPTLRLTSPSRGGG